MINMSTQTFLSFLLAIGTILNDDEKPVVNFLADVSATEGATTTTKNFVFTVALSTPRYRNQAINSLRSFLIVINL